jgi:hypothetical protein
MAPKRVLTQTLKAALKFERDIPESEISGFYASFEPGLMAFNRNDVFHL